MSFSLSKFNAKGELGVSSISKSGVDGFKPGFTGTLSASLPEDFTAKVIFTDGSVKSLKKGVSSKPDGVSLELAKKGLATATFDVATQKAKVVVTKSVEVADQNVDLKGTWTQKDNAFVLEATTKPTKEVKLVLKYNTGTSVAATTVTYAVNDEISVEPTIDSKQAWNVAATYKISKQDSAKATYNSKSEAAVEFSHTEGPAKVTLKLPVKDLKNPVANATIVVEKAWDL
jgi:hypothetical protein